MSQTVPSTSQMVADIFTELGTAFTLLGELDLIMTSDLFPQYRANVTQNDVDRVKAAVKKFAEDIDKLCLRIKNRTLIQIKNSMKRHAYEDAGLPLRKQQMLTAPKPAVAQEKPRAAHTVIPQSSAKSADITLNMLNATEQEVDVEGLTAADKLDYDSTDGP